MALIQCPECGKEISDQAPACIHCGYPLSPAPIPEEPAYTVALLDAAPGPIDTLDILQNKLGMSYADASAAVNNTPAVLACNLTISEVRAIEVLFTKFGRIKVLRDEDASTKDGILGAEWVRPQAEQEEKKQGLSFFGVVGAVMVGIVLMIVVLSLL